MFLCVHDNHAESRRIAGWLNKVCRTVNSVPLVWTCVSGDVLLVLGGGPAPITLNYLNTLLCLSCSWKIQASICFAECKCTAQREENQKPHYTTSRSNVSLLVCEPRCWSKQSSLLLVAILAEMSRIKSKYLVNILLICVRLQKVNHY